MPELLLLHFEGVLVLPSRQSRGLLLTARGVLKPETRVGTYSGAKEPSGLSRNTLPVLDLPWFCFL